MMNRVGSSQVISKRQLFTIVFILVFGKGLFALPSVVAVKARQDGWISVLVSGIISIIAMNAILFLLKYFDGKGLVDISQKLFGKYIGKGIGIIYFIYFLGFAALSIRIAVDLFSAWLLPRTPIEILTIVFLLIAAYAVRNGIKVLGRLNELITWILIPIFPLIIVPFLLRKDLLFLLPVGGAGLSRILQASIPSFYAFMGFEGLFFLYPYVRENATHGEVVKAANMALLIGLLIKWFAVFACIAVFGHIELKFFLYPFLEYFKILSFPIIERVEFVLFYFWIFLTICAHSILLKLSIIPLEQVLNIEGYKNTALFLLIPIYYLLKIPQNVAQVQNYIYIYFAVGISLVWFTIIVIAVGALIHKLLAERSNSR